MSTTETPSWAAAAATDSPPEPAPITHRSTRSVAAAGGRDCSAWSATALSAAVAAGTDPHQADRAVIWLLHGWFSIS